MTLEEAIEQLQFRVDYAKSFEHSDADFVSVEALELAIKALEKKTARYVDRKVKKKDRTEGKDDDKEI